MLLDLLASAIQASSLPSINQPVHSPVFVIPLTLQLQARLQMEPASMDVVRLEPLSIPQVNANVNP